MTDKNDFILEEYRTVCKEKEYQLKMKDYFTVLSLSSGFAIIAYALETKSNEHVCLFYIASLVVFFLGYINFVARWLLGLKSDSYLQYFFPLENEHFKWHLRKAKFSFGSFIGSPTFFIYRFVIPLIYFFAICGSYYFIITTIITREEFTKAKLIILCISILIIAVVYILATLSYSNLIYNSDYFIERWIEHENTIVKERINEIKEMEKSIKKNKNRPLKKF